MRKVHKSAWTDGANQTVQCCNNDTAAGGYFIRLCKSGLKESHIYEEPFDGTVTCKRCLKIMEKSN